MNYKKHYDKLCERAKKRTLEGYGELHHIIPKCLGGSDSKDNIVNLTPEEHYVAHQLLVKIHPQHKGLIWAALQMTGHGNGKRNNNKLYGWLRRKYQSVAKSRTGKKNGSYGKKWYYDPKTLTNIKCLPEDVPEGYLAGRKIKKKLKTTKCKVCKKDTGKKYRKYCEKHYVEFRNSEKLGKSNGKTYDIYALYEEFMKSNYKSITKFAKSKHITPEYLMQVWKKKILEYKEIATIRKSYKDGFIQSEKTTKNGPY